MKKLFLFLSMACAISLVSCGDDDSSDGGSGATSIEITASPSTGVSGDTFTFTVEDDLGNDVTDESTFYVDGTAIDSNEYVAEVEEESTMTITAVYGDLEDSTSILVTIEGGTTTYEPNGEGNFTVDGTEYLADSGAWAYAGIDESGYVYMYLNTYTYDTDAGSYSNDFYLGIVFMAGGPSGTDDDGNAAYTYEDVTPATGEWTWYGDSWVDEEYAIIDAYVIADDAYVFDGEDLSLIDDAIIDLQACDFGTTSGNSVLTADYSLTLTDGTEVEGSFDGTCGFYSLSSSSRNANGINLPNLKVAR